MPGDDHGARHERPHMRLKPPPTAEEALRYLGVNAVLVWGVAETALMEAQLRLIADAMAAVAALEVPEETEPLFAEDIALNPAGDEA